MGEGSIASEFQLKSFKIDRFNFESKPNVNLLTRLEGFSPDEWEVGFRFRIPTFFKKANSYVGGLDVRVFIPENQDQEEEEKEPGESFLVRLDAGIAGAFLVSDEFDKGNEDVLVKIQIPALLLPYLRGAITSFLANAGFGTFIFPLINIHAAAKSALNDLAINIVEE